MISPASACVAHRGSLALVVLASLAVSGCAARTAASIVTAPVKVASSAVDAATTSQSEADEKRGRELREREERLGKLQREYSEEREDCENGDKKACEKASEINAEIQAILPTIPADPDDD
ncbi:MAG: hypothetical protein AAFY19_03710 [Pseudomonadota bacterium]